MTTDHQANDERIEANTLIPRYAVGDALCALAYAVIQTLEEPADVRNGFTTQDALGLFGDAWDLLAGRAEFRTHTSECLASDLFDFVLNLREQNTYHPGLIRDFVTRGLIRAPIELVRSESLV